MYVPLFGVWSLAATAAPATSPAPCAPFVERLHTTYGFRPSKLTPAESEEKVKAMDAVWQMVQHDPGGLGPCLREALAQPTEDGYFLFDGSQLLMSVDPSPASKATLLTALSRVSLDDVDLRAWVATASSLGLEGFDTSSLGRRWLEYPDAHYFLADHGAYEVDRGNGAMFIFGALDERFATPVLADICRTSVGERKEIAAWLLMSQATPDALLEVARLDTTGLSKKALASRESLLKKPDLITPRKQPITSRSQFLGAFAAFLAGDEAPFNKLVETVPDGKRDLVAVCTPEDLDMIRKVRRRYIAGNNQHAIEYYNQFSEILMTLLWKPELVKGPDEVGLQPRRPFAILGATISACSLRDGAASLRGINQTGSSKMHGRETTRRG
jgi:hypothetical protein